MVETLVKNSTPERLDRGEFSQERVVQMGQLAIRSEQLGINDPLTHLYQYLERGDESLVGIKEDIETDIAERLPETPFVNQVGFEFADDDFVSVKDKVSMRSMTENNLHILQVEQSNNPSLLMELARSKVEAQEADKLSAWFTNAPVGTFLIFESLPIGQQKVAVSRIYQKTSEREMNSGFVSLYGPSVEIFNDFRSEMGASKADCTTELEVLENNYEVKTASDQLTMDDFIEKYVGSYDKLKETRTDTKHSFGLIEGERASGEDGVKRVRNQPKLTSIYIDAVRSLATGRGIVSHDLIHINESLGLDFEFKIGDKVSAQTARTVLAEVILGITSAIDRADVDQLFDVEQQNSSINAGYAVVSQYGSEARSEGASYESEACPEFSVSSQFESSKSSTQSEFDKMFGAFGLFDKLPPNFGRPEIGICKTRNCPSRKRPLVTVGGCGFCEKCHRIYQDDKIKISPEKVYDGWKKEVGQEIERKKEAERLRLEKEEAEKIEKEKVLRKKLLKARKSKKQALKENNTPFWSLN